MRELYDMANTSGEKELRTDWPHESGLGVDQKHDGREMHLVAQEGSFIPQRKKEGL